jgi:hypothetical protein
MNRLKVTPTTGIALLALFVALGGSSFAAPVRDAAKQLITGKQVKKNSLSGKHIKDRSLTPADFRGGVPAGPQGERGPQGPAGPAGANGANGQDAVTVWASVRADGTLLGGNGVVSATNDPNNVGSFDLRFDRSVDGCAYSATLFDPYGDHSPGGISVSDLAFAGNGVPPTDLSVSIRNATGAREDQPFHIVVYC